MSVGLSPRDMDLVGLGGAPGCLNFFTSSQVTDGSDTRATLGEALAQLVPWTLGDQLGEHPPEGFVGVVCLPRAGGRHQVLKALGVAWRLPGGRARTQRCAGNAVPPGWQLRAGRECPPPPLLIPHPYFCSPHPRSIQLCLHPVAIAGAHGGYSARGSDQRMHFQEEKEEVSFWKGAEAGRLVGEQTWGVGADLHHSCLFATPSREKMQSQTRDKPPGTGEPQPHGPQLWRPA